MAYIARWPGLQMDKIGNNWRKHTRTQLILWLGNPEAHQVLQSCTQQDEGQIVSRRPSAVNLWQTMSAQSPDRDAALFQLSGGLSTLTSSGPFLQIGRIYPPSLTHIPHPPAPVPPQLVVSSKAGGERAQFLVRVARRLTHSD